MDHFMENDDLALFIDILADMICQYLQTEDATNEANKPASQSQTDAA